MSETVASLGVAGMSDPIAAFFIIGAKYVHLLVLATAAGYFFTQPRERQWRMAGFGAAAALLIFVLSLGLSALYDNPRPFVVTGIPPLIPHEANNGFPSHHTLLCAAVAVSMTVFHLRLGVLLWLLTALVGVSRVYVGVHHLLDVAASMLLAAVVGAVLYALAKRRRLLGE